MKTITLKTLAASLLLFGTTALIAESITINANSYAWIRNDIKDTPQATANDFKVGSTGGTDLRGLLSFNLPATIPANAIISKVTLITTTNAPDSTTDTTELTFSLYGLTTPFTAGKVTWNNPNKDQPTVTWNGGDLTPSSLTSTKITVNAAANQTDGYSWTTSQLFESFVQAALASESRQVNLLIKLDSLPAARRLINFRGTTYPTSGPRLLVEYSISPVPEPTTVALLCGVLALGAGVIHRRFRNIK